MTNAMRAVDAAKKVGASLGLVVEEAIVLHDANRLTVRLLPCDLIARIAPAGDDSAQREVDLTPLLVEAGCPVGPLDPRAAPRAYTECGFDISLWTYLEPARRQLASDDYANALVSLHAGMRKVDTPAPRFTDRISQAQDVINNSEMSPELGDADRPFLSERLSRLRRSVTDRGAAEQLLHGEPHQGNVIDTTSGPIFIDLETVCRGPIEFDLAHVPGAVARLYPEVDHELLSDCRQLVLAMVAAWRWERGDEYPNGRRFGEELLIALRAGPPWPTLDMMNGPDRDTGPSTIESGA